MYDLIKRHMALAEVGRNNQVAQAKLDGLTDYNQQLIGYNVGLDLYATSAARAASHLASSRRSGSLGTT